LRCGIFTDIVNFMQDSPLDPTDTRLLAALQADAQMTAERLGEILNLSPSQAGRRRQRLEASGVIDHYSARLNHAALGLTVQAFVTVQMASHRPDLVATFMRLIETERRITSAFTLTGEADYLLRVYCRDLSELNDLLQNRILPHPAVARVQSQIVMDQPKADAPLPI
jgi:DNA-binding Lrp family transcriptional regulator